MFHFKDKFTWNSIESGTISKEFFVTSAHITLLINMTKSFKRPLHLMKKSAHTKSRCNGWRYDDENVLFLKYLERDSLNR